jgi:hypothetical protein
MNLLFNIQLVEALFFVWNGVSESMLIIGYFIIILGFCPIDKFKPLESKKKMNDPFVVYKW